MFRNVAAIALDGVAPFELGVLCEAFGVDRSDQGLPRVDFAVCGVEPGPVQTSMGFTVVVEEGLGRLAEADLIGVPATPHDGEYPEAVLAELKAAVDRGARVLSVCTGAFVLAAAGLLDGRRYRCVLAHLAERVRRRGGDDDRPTDGRAAPSRGWSGPVRRGADPAGGGADAVRCPRLHGRAPARGHDGRVAGQAREHVAADLRPQVSGRDGHNAV